MRTNSKKRFVALDRKSGEPKQPTERDVLHAYTDSSGGLKVINSDGEVTSLGDTGLTAKLNADNSFGGNKIENFGKGVVTISASTYTIQASDSGKLLRFTAACTVTLPNNLTDKFSCAARQCGAGQITFTAASGATLSNVDAHTKTEKQWASVGLDIDSNSTGTAASWVLTGRTAA